MSYINHAGPQWRACPICGRRTHLQYMSLESFERIRNTGALSLAVYVECTCCHLTMTEQSNGRAYGETVGALLKRWNNRGGWKRGRKAVFSG